MRGAIREDDLGQLFGFRFGGDPHDDPDGPFWRVMNHFYDPVHNRPLAVSPACLTTFRTATGDANDSHAAPHWAAGARDAFNEPDIPEAGRRNHFTLFDAREAMYRALTGKTKDHRDVAPTQAERNKYWATTFRALGDVVHLVEDMAQPQHTRNDAHAGTHLCFGHASVYEAYIECRATGGIVESISNAASAAGAKPKQCVPLVYHDPDQPYPIPRFTRYGDFFGTEPGGDVSKGAGLADYSNRGFFTAGTNLGTKEAAQYPLPSNKAEAYDKEQIALTTVDDVYQDRMVPLSILKGAVPDRLTGVDAPDIPLTTEGMWYLPLAEVSNPANADAHGYTLTRPNYDAMANLLIPRAVADAPDVQYRPVHCGPTGRSDDLPAIDGCARSLA